MQYTLCVVYECYGKLHWNLTFLPCFKGLYKKQIAEEEKLIQQLEGKIKEFESSVNKQRKNMGG